MADPSSQLIQWLTMASAILVCAILVWFGSEVVNLGNSVTSLSERIISLQNDVRLVKDNAYNINNHEIRIRILERRTAGVDKSGSSLGFHPNYEDNN